MKPTKWQYLFAQQWPSQVVLLGGPILFAAGVVRSINPTSNDLKDWSSFTWLLATILISLSLGWFFALIAGGCTLGPFYEYRGNKNGAPFEIGDRVRILAGPHRDRIALVYALWQHGSVRLEIGDNEREELNDIFVPHQILKIQDSEAETSPLGMP